MQRKLAMVLIAVMAIVPAWVASAGPGVEDGDRYETAYLAACGARLPPASCQCTMEVIEDTLTYDAFTTLVARFGGDIRRALPAERVDPAVAQSCGIADLSGARTTDVTERARTQE